MFRLGQLCSVLCLALGLALVIPLRAQVTLTASQAVPGLTEKVLLDIDHRQVTDAGFQKLAIAVGNNVPVEQWPTVKIEKGEGLEAVIDRYYDFYWSNKDSSQFPKTVAALVRIIADKNHVDPSKLKEGKPLSLPPVPGRPSATAVSNTKSRFYDPESNMILIWGNGLVQPDKCGTWTACSEASTARSTSNTYWTVNPATANELIGVPGVIEVPQNLLSIELLGDEPCTAPENRADAVVLRSPYRAAALARIDQSRSKIVSAASAVRLSIIDFDFNAGHGAKVRAAAEWLLKSAGLPELAGSLRPVELSPQRDQSEFVKQTDTVVAYQVWGQNRGVSTDQAGAALFWLRDPRSVAREFDVSVPPVFLQAQIWWELQRKNWISLSWRTSGATGALPAAYDAALRDADGFIAVAAGNDLDMELGSDRTPQSAANGNPQFVNVTYGFRDGGIRGTQTSLQRGRVHISAQGCGFDTPRITTNDAGSSYASPVAAAAAWVKRLMDDTPGAKMRNELLRASSMVPAQQQKPGIGKVVAHGFFDPMRLLASPGPHYVAKNDQETFIPLGDVRLITNCDGGLAGNVESGYRDVVVYKEDGKYFLLRRTVEKDQANDVMPRRCEVTQLTLTAKAGAQDLTISSPEDFERRIIYLNY